MYNIIKFYDQVKVLYFIDVENEGLEYVSDMVNLVRYLFGQENYFYFFFCGSKKEFVGLFLKKKKLF